MKHQVHSCMFCTALWLLAMNFHACLAGEGRLSLSMDTAGQSCKWTIRSGNITSEANVPGDVNDDLEKAGKLPPLFFGVNSMQAQWVPARDWTYQCMFNSPAWLKQYKLALLHFAGVDYNTTVMLNGVTLGTHVGSFSPFKFPVTDVLHKNSTQNKLEVIVHAMDPKVLAALWVTDPMGGGARSTYTAGSQMRQRLLYWKAAVGNGGGVDFGTPHWPLGIWKSVTLMFMEHDPLRLDVTSPLVHLDQDSMVVLPTIDHSYQWATLHMSINLKVTASGHLPQRHLTVVWGAQCLTDSSATSVHTANMSVQPNTSMMTLRASLRLPKPRLWWPNGYGEQHLYSATVTLYDHDEAFDHSVKVDVVNTSFGVRQLELLNNSLPPEGSWLYTDYGVRKPCDNDLDDWCDGGYESFGTRNSSNPGPGGLPDQPTKWAIAINGVRIFARGANWVPADLFNGRVTADRLREIMRMIAGANMNFLRIWGGGIVEKQAFLQAADEQGIMLLYEMPHMAPRPDPSRPGVLAAEAAETRTAVLQLINHPSVVQYGFGNELYVNGSWCHTFQQYVDIIAAMENVSMLGEVPNARQARWADPSPSGERHGPYTFWFHRNSQGNVEVSYDIYNWGCGRNVKPGYRCEDSGLPTGPGFPFQWSEVGACAMPSIDTLQNFLPSASLWPINESDPMWHWHNAFGVQRNDSWLNPASYRWLFTKSRGPLGTWPAPLPTLTAEVQCSQFAQAEGYRYIFASMRWAKWVRSLVAIWTFNEPWPNAAHGSLLDWYGRPKMAFYAARRTNAMVTASLRYSDIWQRVGMPINGTVWFESELQQPLHHAKLEIQYWLPSGHCLHNDTVDDITIPASTSYQADVLHYVLPRDVINQTVMVFLDMYGTTSRHSPSSATFQDAWTFAAVNDDAVADSISAPLSALRTAPSAILEVKLISAGKVSIQNVGSSIALFVKLILSEGGSQTVDGSEVEVPFILFSDNYFSLRPREARFVTCRECVELQRLCVSGWNVLQSCATLTLSALGGLQQYV